MPSHQLELGPAELEVLKVLWDAEPATVRAVLSQLHRRGRRLAYTTVQTLLTRLEHKGCVKSDKTGMAYIYRSAVSRERISITRIRSILQQLYDGAAAPLVLQLMKAERFSSEEIAALQKLIDQLDPIKDRPKRR